MFYYTRLERPAKNKHSSLLGPLVSYEGKKCCEYSPWSCIHGTSFSSELTKNPSKLVCYFTVGCKGLPGKTL
jgi:hypothetical protein